MATIQDRIRIPWRGGAKQISSDTLVPVLLMPGLLTLTAFDQILAILVLVIFLLFFNNVSNWFLANNPRSKFFVAWAITSFVTVAFIFEFKVIALLEILPEENIWLSLLFFVFGGLTYVVWSKAPKFKAGVLGDMEESGENIEEDFCITCRRKLCERMHHCSVCQVCVPEKNFHFYWFDCCIGQTNNGFFMLALFFAIASLLYSSNLTLTTVCHPFTVFGTVMLPDDCSEVYEQFDMSICFVSAIYSIIIAVYLLWILLRQVLLVSLGLTGHEWFQLPLGRRLTCALRSNRAYSKGCFRNWYTLLFYSNKGKSNMYIET